CGEASALNWLPRGRVRTYAADSSAESRSTGPSILTCRPSGSQWNSNAARGLAASSEPFRLSQLVKNTNPPSPVCLTSTIRTDGAPSADAVATAAASGDRTPARAASSNQSSNCRNGSASTSCSSRGRENSGITEQVERKPGGERHDR